MVHRKQFTKHAKVNGKGIDFDDFCSMTCFNVAKGLANNSRQSTTPSAPTAVLAIRSGRASASKVVSNAITTTAYRCLDIIPSEEAFG